MAKKTARVEASSLPLSVSPAALAKARPVARPRAAALTASPRPASPALLSERKRSLERPLRGRAVKAPGRPKAFPHFTPDHDFGHPNNSPGLPESYGRDRLVLMPKDPVTLFCYWEITPTLLCAKEAEKKPEERYSEMMRLTWNAQALLEPNFVFLDVRFPARKWYYRVPEGERDYQVELGWLSEAGHFISVLTSNSTRMSEAWASGSGRLRGQGPLLDFLLENSGPAGASETLRRPPGEGFSPLSSGSSPGSGFIQF